MTPERLGEITQVSVVLGLHVTHTRELIAELHSQADQIQSLIRENQKIREEYAGQREQVTALTGTLARYREENDKLITENKVLARQRETMTPERLLE